MTSLRNREKSDLHAQGRELGISLVVCTDNDQQHF
jgi:hypothetical protein